MLAMIAVALFDPFLENGFVDHSQIAPPSQEPTP
jgi:hypothetical protein